MTSPEFPAQVMHPLPEFDCNSSPLLLPVFGGFLVKEVSVQDGATIDQELSKDSGPIFNWGAFAEESGAEEKVVSLNSYGSDISFGSGGVTYNDNKAVFYTRGTSNAGYVYLKNSRDLDFRVGTQSSGLIVLQSEGEW